MSWLLIESEAVEEGTGLEFKFQNVLPNWGPDHVFSPDCWCDPHIEWVHESGAVVTHNGVN